MKSNIYHGNSTGFTFCPKPVPPRSNVLYLQIVSFSLRYSEVRGNLYSKDYFVSVHSFIFSKN